MSGLIDAALAPINNTVNGWMGTYNPPVVNESFADAVANWDASQYGQVGDHRGGDPQTGLRPFPMTEAQYYARYPKAAGAKAFQQQQQTQAGALALRQALGSGLADVLASLGAINTQTAPAPLYNPITPTPVSVVPPAVIERLTTMVSTKITETTPIAGDGITVTKTDAGTTVSVVPPDPGTGIGVITVGGVPRISNTGVISVIGSNGISAVGTNPTTVKAISPVVTFFWQAATFDATNAFIYTYQNDLGVHIHGWLKATGTQTNVQFVQITAPVYGTKFYGRFWNYPAGTDTIIDSVNDSVLISHPDSRTTVFTAQTVPVELTTRFYVDIICYEQ